MKPGLRRRSSEPPAYAIFVTSADVIEATREFLVCVATDDMERLGASGGIFERIGLESARGGVEAEALYDSIRMAAGLAQAEVHRAVPLAPQHLDPEAVLGLPVAADELATTLRPLMADVDCIVGPAVPITEFPDSLAMGQRLSALRAVAHSGPTFVDDSLLELVCVADPVAVRALRRKYFGELDRLPRTSVRCSSRRSASGCSSGATGRGSPRPSRFTRRP